MFEWQRHSQDSVDVPHYQDILNFIDLRAQASESLSSDTGKKLSKPDSGTSWKRGTSSSKPVASFVGGAESSSNCVVCKTEKHPLYMCPKFKSLDHEHKTSMLKSNSLCINCMSLCINCMKPGHFVKNCKSLHRCKVCQKPHHTLLHLDEKIKAVDAPSHSAMPNPSVLIAPVSSSHVSTGIKSDMLLMTCRVHVEAPDGSTLEARALLDSGSSASFISERLAQSLHLPRSDRNTTISGVAGFSRNSTRSITSFSILSTLTPARKFFTTAVVVPRVTCDLPLCQVHPSQNWSHLSGLQLADPCFGQPGRIDLLLGVDIFAEVMLDGRRTGAPGSPVAFETQLGWVLAGSANSCTPTHAVTVHHATLLTGDDLLRRFWEIEEKVAPDLCLMQEEKAALDHFNKNHSRLQDGRFVVPLPMKPGIKPLGESRSQAVRRFTYFERSLHVKSQFPEFKLVVDEYFESGHAEPVPEADLHKATDCIFYLPMHAVRKDTSTTTKVRAVFDAEASSGVSLNDKLLIGPTVHSSLVDVLLRFQLHRVALIADVSRMYRAIALTESDRDLHRFVWRDSPDQPLRDYRMTRLTFGVSASSFIANMCVKQNALDFSLQYPLAVQAVNDSFYVDDGLTGADSVAQAVELHHQLQDLFGKGGFLLRKWNSSFATH